MDLLVGGHNGFSACEQEQEETRASGFASCGKQATVFLFPTLLLCEERRARTSDQFGTSGKRILVDFCGVFDDGTVGTDTGCNGGSGNKEPKLRRDASPASSQVSSQLFLVSVRGKANLSTTEEEEASPDEKDSFRVLGASSPFTATHVPESEPWEVECKEGKITLLGDPGDPELLNDDSRRVVRHS
jgi:hypothetical protein